MPRAAFYVDGFNLYHAINDLNEPFLKWLDLRKLAGLLVPTKTETVERIVYCTAFYPGDSQKRFRHEEYLRALDVTGVIAIPGHYIHEERECRACGAKWQQPTEKQTDINVAAHLLNDAWLDRYDRAYLISADSDQAATARLFRAQFPTKEFVTVAPPGRNFSSAILAHSHAKISINRDHLERCLFPPIVFEEGKRAGRRPREYDPPAGWVAPDKRPKHP